MNTLIISPKKNLIDEIIPHLKAAGMDYSSNLIVFAGKRPSHFLRKAIAEKVKGSFIPPAVFSMDEFIDYVYEASQTRRKLEAIDAAAILYDIQLKLPKPVGGKNFMSSDSFFSIGLKIYQDIEELYIEKIGIQRVKGIEQYADAAITPEGMERFESLSNLYEEFYKAVESSGFSTRSVRYRAASEMIDKAEFGNFQQIIFAGFYAFTEAEKILFKKILSRSNTLFIFQQGVGLKERLADLGIDIDDKQNTDADPKIHFYSSPDTHGQVYALSKALETGLNEKNSLDEKTAIVLPQPETLFPLLYQGMPAIDKDDYNISLGYPLFRTPVFGFLNNLMELITSMDGDRFYIPDYLKFVLHPYTKNILYKKSPKFTRIIIHTLEESFARHPEKTFLTLSEIENNKEYHKKNRVRTSESEEEIDTEGIKTHLRYIHQNTIEKFTSFKNVKDFSERCIELLVFIFNNSTAKHHPLFHPFSESFLSSLNTVSISLMKDIAFTDISSYFSFLKRFIMSVYSPFEGSPIKGLQVIGFLEIRNLKFDTVFVMDANEEALPSTRKDESFLPFRARKMLGIPTYQDKDRLSAYYFETLLKGAKEAHLFFIENNNKERSRFVEKLIWEIQKKDKRIDKGLIKTVKYDVNLENSKTTEIPKTGNIISFLKDFAYSASSVNDYLKCQLKFYYAHVLNLGKKEDISGDIDKKGIGSIVHKILSGYFSRRINLRLKESDINIDEIESLTDDIFRKNYGENLFGAVYLLKKQVKNRAKELLRDYYIPIIREKPVTILGSEAEIQSISIDSFKIKGRLDSIEKRGDKTFIIDFKIASNDNYLKIKFNKLDPNNRETWSEAIGSIQLPFYLMLYSNYKEAKIKDLNAMFLLLGRSVINNDIEHPLCDDSDVEGAYKTMQDIILSLLKEIIDISMPFAPAKNKEDTCPSCDFRNICGAQWIGGRK
ncbi:MAG: PD-(D/E)XK nuclease family protein [Nitrospirae bacterium]|nr:PD-(D/E)XK nuclease family protein [Nitrospirota bacterium]